MSKFTLTATLFAAAYAASQEGRDMAEYAANLVSFGAWDEAATFVKAFDAKVANEAESLSLSSVRETVSKLHKASQSHLAAVKANAEHNRKHPNTPTMLAYIYDKEADEARLAITLAPKPRKPRKTTTRTTGEGMSPNSNIDGATVAKACHKADDYEYKVTGLSKKKGGNGVVHHLNGVAVKHGQFIQDLFALCPSEDSATRKYLRRYGKKPRGE